MTYPWAALATAMGVSENQAVMTLGVNGRMGQLYRHQGMSERVAERLAVKAGFHPAEVWPEWLDHSIEAAKVECPVCLVMFLPSRRTHRVCSQNCRQKRWQNQRYAESPEFRAKRRADTAAYYADHGEYVRGRMRRYRAVRANG